MAIYRRDVLIGALATAMSGCLSGATPSGRHIGERLRVAASTSTYDTDVIHQLHAGFEAETGARMETLPMGTGAALAAGSRKDVDAVVVHAPQLEQAFLDNGHGRDRYPIMQNDFVIVGPATDPGNIQEKKDASAAFRAIAERRLPFLSRGDDSGTHHREQEIWRTTDGYPTSGDWYQAVGAGQGELLVQANQRAAYALTDRGTMRSMRPRDLSIHLGGEMGEGSPLLRNVYSVIPVVSDESAKADLLDAYVNFLTGDHGQSIIAERTVGGEPLFEPIAPNEGASYP